MIAARCLAGAALALATFAVAGCADRPASQRAGTEAPAPASETGADVVSGTKTFAKLCEHKVPAELCTRCSPELADVFRDQGDWCDEHGVPESQCFDCNPDLRFDTQASVPADWCREHAVPESKCARCNPSRIAALIESGNYCREHGHAADVCPYCHPELVRAAGQVPPAEASLDVRVRLASPETVRDAGIETTRVWSGKFARTLEAVGRLSFDRNNLVQLSAQGEARILEVHADAGDDVAAGAPLVVLASRLVGEGRAQLAIARAQLDAATANLERERGLVAKGISPRKRLEEASVEHARARAAYEEAGAGLGIVGATAAGQGGNYVLSSPLAGTVVSRDAVIGRNVEDGHILLEIADLAEIWALLDVPESDVRDVRADQPVEITFEGLRGDPIRSVVSRVGNSVDPATRSVQVRVELANADRRLKAGTYVRARIEVASEHDAVLVPKDSVQQVEGRKIVFVRKAETLFVPVTVQVGAEDRGKVEITKGISSGDEIVTTGAFLLKTEVTKDSIGAGCCEESK